jgi:hypothetical protein
MNGLPLGTICFVVKTEPGREHRLGRVVEVVSSLHPVPKRDGMLMYQVDAEWLRAERQQCRWYAAPAALRPISGPQTEPPATREPTPEYA